jgi:hypothetical protein
VGEILVPNPAGITVSFTAVGEFSTGNQPSGNTLHTARCFKTKGNLWCREGESNPQGTKYRRILSPVIPFSNQPILFSLQRLAIDRVCGLCGPVKTREELTGKV